MTRPWWTGPVPGISREAEAGARERQERLTKPTGSLGHLEELAVRFAGLQGRSRPTLERIALTVFAADHGIAGRGVSAYPQEITAAMLGNFSQGGAAVNVLARRIGAGLEVVDLGTASDPGSLPGVRRERIASGTAPFDRQAAMTPEELDKALAAGRGAIERARVLGAELFIGGEMGIGNSASAAALACALTGRDPGSMVGRGTGLGDRGMARKVAAVREGIRLHRPNPENPSEALRRLGGLEIAALAGAYIASAQEGLPVVVDGFIATAAAVAATALNPGVPPWLVFGHRSAEPGHRHLLEALGARPLLDLGLRLGEGTGAAAAVGLLRHALALHNEMATFSEAGLRSH